MATFFYVTDTGGDTANFGVDGCGRTEDHPKQWSPIDGPALMTSYDSAGHHWRFRRGGVYTFSHVVTTYGALITGDGTSAASLDTHYSIDAYGTGDDPVITPMASLLSLTTNEFVQAGGLYTLDVSDVAFLDSHFFYAKQDALTLHALGSVALLENSDSGAFYYDSANKVLYLRCFNDADPMLCDIKISPYRSGTIYVSGTYKQVRNVSFQDSGGAYGGLFLGNKPGMVVEKCSFLRGSAGLRIDATGAIIDDCVFRDIWNGGSKEDVGSGTAVDMRAAAIVKNSKFIGNYIGFLVIGNLANGLVQGNSFHKQLINGIDIQTNYGGTAGNPLVIENNVMLHEPLDSEWLTGDDIVGHGITCRAGAHDIIFRKNCVVNSSPSVGVNTGRLYTTEAFRIHNTPGVNIEEYNNNFYCSTHNSESVRTAMDGTDATYLNGETQEWRTATGLGRVTLFSDPELVETDGVMSLKPGGRGDRMINGTAGFGDWQDCDTTLSTDGTIFKSHTLPIAAKKLTVFPGVASAAQIAEASDE